MDRTARAALLAGLIGFITVAGLGAYLVPGAPVAAMVAGLIAGALAALLIVAAARRAESFDEPATPVRPSHPGEPESSSDESDDEHETHKDDRG